MGADLDPLHDEINNCQEKRTTFTEIRNRIINLHQELSNLDNKLDFSDYNVLSNNDFITAYRVYINNILSADPILECLSKEKQISLIEQALSKLSNDVADFNAYKTKLLGIYEDEIFLIDVNSIYQRFKTEYTWGCFNFIKSSYRSDIKLFKGLLKQFGGSVSNESIIAALVDLRSMNKIQSDLSAAEQTYRKYFGNSYQGTNTNTNLLKRKLSVYKALNVCLEELDKLQVVVEAHIKDESILQAHYEHLYQGIDTDWPSVRAALDWAINFKAALGNSIQKNIYFITEVCSTSKFNAVSEEYCTMLANWKLSINQDYTWIKSLFLSNIDFDNIHFDIIKEKFLYCINNMKQLENWIDYNNCRNQMFKSGLSSYIEAIEENNISCHDLLPAFNKRFYKLWLDQVLPYHQAISNFRGHTHEDIIDEFKNLDKQQMIIAKYRLSEKLINSLPVTNNMTNGKDEVALLNRELNKQRRIMPIRKLFQKIPNLLLRLKPCLMMSPLTVSLYLESDAFQFDTVIFDEASQICTENAIGAIMRAKQVIIAGDSKQLPPSNFFITSTIGDDEYNNDDDAQNDVFESLINEASLLPAKTLQWHYRSRHEHLITFSNRKFYKNQLITFPSNKEQGIDNGVEYEYVPNGFYDRGGRNGNFIEAKCVADMVFEHFKKCRDGIFNRSLGVITFGEIQATAVETALNMKRRENPEFENYFSEDNEEHFFVKSLENVQGDERDTIIFSIGYAKDKDGNMIMAFGPLNKSGGERRLNVAITRAKYNIKLVGSILPTDINLDRINSEGPRLLRAYIDFAKNGVTALDSEVITKDDLVFDSPFEEAVYNFLFSKGYKVKTQVGCSSYRIDLAVQHPELNNTFVLGVECDGASYHSAKTARERDRLRQDVLENMGWKFHRIWSTDWIKDPISEGNRLIQAVERAILEYTEVILTPKSDSKSTEEDVYIKENPVSPDNHDNSANLYNFEEYPDLSYKELFVSEEDIPNKLLYLIKTGYPIHFISLCQEVIVDMGRSKLTTAAKSDVEKYLKKIRTKIIRKDDFFYPKNYTTIHARQIGNRNIEQISQEELCAGILKVVKTCVGIKPDDLLQETIKAFGFGRRTVKISTAFEAAYQKLITDKSVIEKAGKTFSVDF